MTSRTPRPRRPVLSILSARLALTALVASLPASAGTPPPGFVETQVVSTSSSTGASGPTAVAYQPGTGDLWVLEKGAGSIEGSARVRVRSAISGLVSTALTLDCVDSRGERGLLGIAFSPGFLNPGGADRHVFLFYVRRIAAAGTCSISGESETSRFRVSRFTESGSTLSGELVVLEGPDLNAATNHNGGTLRFAPDDTLYISTGDNDTDATVNPLSRDLSDLRGKLLRINADGSIPVDNPFVGQAGVRPEIWAWGLRNPFRFGIDPDSGAPIIGDVGEGTWEAIYWGLAGADYGYPCFEGSATFRTCNPAPAPGSVTGPIFEYGHGLETPPVSGNSVTGGPVYRHTAFPEEYRANYFFGDFVDDWIRRGRLSESGQLVDVEMFMPDATGVVDIVVSPDGCLTWVGIQGGGVREVCYAGGTNGQPQAQSSATPMSGLASLNVQFTGSQSTDPDPLDTLLYSWDFDDASSSALADPSHVYTTDGVYQAVLTVDDQQGEVNSTDAAPPLRIVVGNRSPSVVIGSPSAGSFYNAGDTITFSGSSSDPEEGSLPAGQLSWTIVFHHDTHTHPFLGPINGVAGGQFVVPATGEDAIDVFYRVHLTASDTGAPLGPVGVLSSTTHVDIQPNVSQLTLAANPAGSGLELEYDHLSAPAPIVRDSIVGFPRTLGARSPQTTGSGTFFFQSWSDGGPAVHDITTPAADTTYTADFAACTVLDDIVLSNDTVSGIQSRAACLSITVGPAYIVEGTGDLTLTAGEVIIFEDGFSVDAGGKLIAGIGPTI